MLFLCRIIFIDILQKLQKHCKAGFHPHWCWKQIINVWKTLWHCNIQFLHTMIDHLVYLILVQNGLYHQNTQNVIILMPVSTIISINLIYQAFNWVCNANLYWSFMKKLPIRCRSCDITSCGHTSRIASHPRIWFTHFGTVTQSCVMAKVEDARIHTH